MDAEGLWKVANTIKRAVWMVRSFSIGGWPRSTADSHAFDLMSFWWFCECRVSCFSVFCVSSHHDTHIFPLRLLTMEWPHWRHLVPLCIHAQCHNCTGEWGACDSPWLNLRRMKLPDFFFRMRTRKYLRLCQPPLTLLISPPSLHHLDSNQGRRGRQESYDFHWGGYVLEGVESVASWEE